MKSVFKEKYTGKKVYAYQHFETLGYPDLESYFDISGSSAVRNIIWTPRWSYDPKIGGSHFFEYKELPLALKEKYSEIGIVFRPHPLMFDE